MSDRLHSYFRRHWAFREQLLSSSHRQVAYETGKDFLAFFGGSNLFFPFSMDRQLEAIFRRAGLQDVVLNLGSFGFCDSRHVLDTTSSLLRSWRKRRPRILVYEVNPNEMPPVDGEAAEVLVRKPWRSFSILDHEDGESMKDALERTPILLRPRLNDLADLAAAHQLPVQLLDFESNIRDWAPSISAFSHPVSPGEAAAFRHLIERAIEAHRLRRDSETDLHLRACREIDPGVALLRYLTGRLALRRGDLDGAATELRAARDADLVRGRTIQGLAAQDLSGLCRELGFGFLSVPDLIAQSDPMPPGFDLFLDDVHYQPGVHLRIAIALARELADRGLLASATDLSALSAPMSQVDSGAHRPFVLAQIALDLIQAQPSPYQDDRIRQARSLLALARTAGLSGALADDLERRFEVSLRSRGERVIQPPEEPTASLDLEQVVAVIRRGLRERFSIEVTAADFDTDLRALGLDSLSLLSFAMEVLEEGLGRSLAGVDLAIDRVLSVSALVELCGEAKPGRARTAHRSALDRHRLRLARRRCVADPGDPVALRGLALASLEGSTLGGMIERVCRHRPDSLALSFLVEGGGGGRERTLQLTRGQLLAAAQRAAAGLSDAAVGAGDPVVIMTGHQLETVTALVGALLLQAIPCVLHTPSAKMSREVFLETFGQIVDTSGARHVICRQHEHDFVAGSLPDGLCVLAGERLAAAGGAPERSAERAAVDAHSVALLQHSSGTTGVRKGVELTHRALLRQIHHLAEAIDLRQDDRVASWLPLYHDMGLIASLLTPLVAGIPTLLQSPFDWIVKPDRFLQAVSDDRSTLAWLPNFAFHFLAERIRLDPQRPIDLSSLRLLINCSEPIDALAWERLYQRLSPAGLSRFAYGTSYAMAENIFAVTQAGADGPVPMDHVSAPALRAQNRAIATCDPDAETVAVTSSGRAIPGTTIRIVDEEGRELVDRQIGEIVVAGDCLAAGYRGDAASSLAFTDQGFRSGDLGYLDRGWLYVLGRQGDTVIVAGQNLYPQEIERVVGRLPGVKSGRVVAFGVDHESLGTQRLVVLAEVDPGQLRPAGPNRAGGRRGLLEGELQALRTTISAALFELLAIGVPDVLLLAPGALRKSSSGKPSRRLMRSLYLEQALEPLAGIVDER